MKSSRSLSASRRRAIGAGLGLLSAAAVLVAVSCGRGGEHPATAHGVPTAAPAQPNGMADMEGKGGMAPGEIRIDPARQQLIGVTYGTVERRDVVQTIRTVGTITYDETRLADVTLKFHGWVEDLRVDQTGILVRQGDVLFTFYSPELVSTQEEYLTAYEHYRRLQGAGNPQAVEGARRLLEAARQRLAYWDIKPVHLRDIEESRTIVRALPIHSPATGYVIEKHVVAGSHVQAGQMLYRIVNLDAVWVLADVYEYELPFVRLGQEAEVTLAYLPSESFAGRVTYIYPYLEAKERTVKVRVELPNPDHRLKAEMYANVVFQAPRAGVVVIPQSAVLDSGVRKVVFISRGEGRFEPREVTLGATLEGFYEVLGGLAAGDNIVTSANFLLDSESQLAAGMRQMQH